MDYLNHYDNYIECIDKNWGNCNWRKDIECCSFETLDEYFYVKSVLEEANSLEGWIYIGEDVSNPGIAKIGMTTKKIVSREQCTQNPFYQIIFAFKVKVRYATRRQLTRIEKTLMDFLEEKGGRIEHVSTGRLSEWFSMSPQVMIRSCFDIIYSDENLLEFFSIIDIPNKNIATLIDEGDPYLQQEYRPELMGWDANKSIRSKPYVHVQKP